MLHFVWLLLLVVPGHAFLNFFSAGAKPVCRLGNAKLEFYSVRRCIARIEDRISQGRSFLVDIDRSVGEELADYADKLESGGIKIKVLNLDPAQEVEEAITQYGEAALTGLQATVAVSAASWGVCSLANSIPQLPWTVADGLVRGIGGAMCSSSPSLPHAVSATAGEILRWSLPLSPLLLGTAAAYLGGKYSLSVLKGTWVSLQIDPAGRETSQREDEVDVDEF